MIHEVVWDPWWNRAAQGAGLLINRSKVKSREALHPPKLNPTPKTQQVQNTAIVAHEIGPSSPIKITTKRTPNRAQGTASCVLSGQSKPMTNMTSALSKKP